MSTDPCSCIQGCIAICRCLKDIDDLRSNLNQDYDYSRVKWPDLQNKIATVQERQEKGNASDDQQQWLNRARDESNRLGTILQSLPSHCLCCHLYFRKIHERKASLQRLLEDPCLQRIVAPTQTPPVVQLGAVEMIGMEKKFQEFWELFFNESAPIICIHGMPGTGKSVFLTNVNNEFQKSERRGDFEKVIWVNSSSTRDIKDVQTAIAERLGLESSPTAPREQRAGDICAVLNRTNFILLLDNLSDGLELSAIGVPYRPTPGNEKKCKIIFTAQRTGIWSHLSPQLKEFDLGFLDNESATLLFNNKVGIETLNAVRERQARAQELNGDLADEIVKMCSGLPVALVTIGEHLRNKRQPADWRDTIDRLKCPETAGPENCVYQLLSSAYMSLRNSTTQAESSERECFLYCCLYPGGHPIEEEELKLHWLAEGFLGKDDRSLSRGDSILDTLKQVHLLMRAGDQPAIEMHLQVYNLARWISSGNLTERELKFFFVRSSSELQELPENRDWEQVNRISLVDTTIGTLNMINCPSLSTLILKRCAITNISSDFFNSIKKLKVLNLSKSSFPEIRSEISGLTSLQYLNLSHSNISELTGDFKHLSKLIFLDLSFTLKLEKIADGVLSNLSSLRWLNMYYCGVGQKTQRGSSSSPLELMALLNEVHGLQSLQDLGITVRSSTALTRLGESRHLKNTHSIQITDCDTAYIPNSTSAASEREVNLTAIASARSLKVLHIINCQGFLRFQETLIRAGKCFQNLRDIKIEDCMKLTDLTWLRHAQALESLEIDHCPYLTELILCGRGNPGTAAGQGNQVPFSNLKYLHLNGLSSLLSICFQNLPFRELKNITVLSCSKLKGISIDIAIDRPVSIPIICQKLWWEKNLDADTKSKLFPVFR